MSLPPPSSARVIGTPGYLLYKAGVLAQQGIDAALDEVELSPRQFLLVSFVAEGGLSQQDVARRLGIDPTLVGAAVDELEARGLVDRSRDPADRRRYALSLTDVGTALLERAERRAARAQEELLGPLSQDERDALSALLLQVVQPRLPWLGGA